MDSERYERLFHQSEYCYIKGAPIIVEAGALLKDTYSNTILAQLKFKNISEKSIKAVRVILFLQDTIGNSLNKKVDFQYLDLQAKRDDEFGTQVPIKIEDYNTREFTICITEVVFGDNTLWRGEETVWPLIMKQTPLMTILEDKDLFDQFQLSYGTNSTVFPSAIEDIWYCACGEINHDYESNCHKCKRQKEALLSFDLKQLINEKNQRLEEKEKERLIQNKKRNQRKKRALISAFVLAGIIITLLLIVNVLLPYSKYKKASQLADKQQYDEAITLYESLGKYRDSEQRILKTKKEKEEYLLSLEAEQNETVYQNAEELYNQKKYIDAAKEFEKIEDYSDSKERVKECLYFQAEYLFQNGRYDDASELYNSISEYKDSEEKALEARYNKADGLEQKGSTFEAAKLFFSLDMYKDSKSRSFSLWDQLVNNHSIAAGYGAHQRTTVAVFQDGTVQAVGTNEIYKKYTNGGQCDVNNWQNVIAVTADGVSTAALLNNRTVVTTGNNNYGQNETSEWTDIVSIDCNSGFKLGLKADGTVLAIGENNFGQCNVSDWNDIIGISAGSYFSLGLKADGTVVSTKEYEFSDWKDIISISAGRGNAFGVKKDGTVAIAGDDNGFNKSAVQDWTDIVRISAGPRHTIGLKEDGTVVSTGANDYGQCDLGDWTDIVDIIADEYRSIGLRKDGTIVIKGAEFQNENAVEDWKGILVQ